MLDPGPADIVVKVLELRTYNAKQFLTLSQVFAKIFASCRIRTLDLPNQTLAIVLISRMTTAVGRYMLATNLYSRGPDCK